MEQQFSLTKKPQAPIEFFRNRAWFFQKKLLDGNFQGENRIEYFSARADSLLSKERVNASDVNNAVECFRLAIGLTPGSAEKKEIEQKIHDAFMKLAIQASRDGAVRKLEGDPFGAIIVRNNRVLVVANNETFKSYDDSAHAEVVAIRKAGKKLKRRDLSDCILYTSCEPCAMCTGDMLQSRIRLVYMAATEQDAANHNYMERTQKKALVKTPKTNNDEEMVFDALDFDVKPYELRMVKMPHMIEKAISVMDEVARMKNRGKSIA